MLKISKFSIGVRTSSKMFRVTTLAGSLIDNILDLRGSKKISNEYFSEVSKNLEQGQLKLNSNLNGNSLLIDLDNIILTKDFYEESKKLDLKAAIEEFDELWTCINNTLKIKDVRRIGLVAEHRLEVDEGASTMQLLEKYTSQNSTSQASKFMLKYENHSLAKDGKIPDPEKSSFVNIIREYYDSELDANHPAKGHINTNIDVQQYYSPLLSSNIHTEILKLKKTFNDEWELLETELKSKGLA